MTDKPRWYFDPISPFAYFQWWELQKRDLLKDLDLKPVLFAGLLNHHGHKGPAEIPKKRVLTMRHVLWISKKHDIPFRLPDSHPFNPIPLLRLCLANDCDEKTIRSVFEFVWKEGRSGVDPNHFVELCKSVGVKDFDSAVKESHAKQKLIQNSEDAIEDGVFGVPSLVIRDEVFWGWDTTELAIDFLNNPKLFDTEEMRHAATIQPSSQRK